MVESNEIAIPSSSSPWDTLFRLANETVEKDDLASEFTAEGYKLLMIAFDEFRLIDPKGQ